MITEDVAIKIGYVPVESALQQKLEIVTLAEKVTIIGVVKDTNILPLNVEAAPPQIFFLRRDSQEEQVDRT